MCFSGKYYDGKSSKAIPVEFSVDSLYYYLHPLDESHEEIRLSQHEVNSYEKNNKKILIKFGKAFPFPLLETESGDLEDTLRAIRPEVLYIRTPYNFFLKRGIKGIAMAVLLLAALLSLVYFYVIPFSMEMLVSIFPRSTEEKMGKSFKETFLASAEVDTNKTKAVNEFYSYLKVPTEYKIHFTVVNSDIQNAFALPGGEIVIFSSIIDSMKTYNELVALMGHEVGHVEKRHSLKMLFRNASNYLIISALTQDFSGIISVLLDNAGSLGQMAYSREKEEESDEFGFEVIKINSTDPKGMVDLFEQLNKGHEGFDMPVFLQTHPSLQSRIKVTEERIKKEKVEIHDHPELSGWFAEIKRLSEVPAE